MGTAKQLIPAFVDAEPLEFGDRSYSKNMRPIRGYPNYWRIIDREAFIDGPPSEGSLYTKELFLWQADVLLDDNSDLTDTVEVVNLGDYLTVTSTEANGETTYRYKYNSGIESFQYQHTAVIDSVSIEFDQLGRRIISFESSGNVYLLWFDPQQGTETLTNFGAGYNPYVVTDSYTRTGDVNNSERLLFYVKDSTKQIVYRRQDDRYGVEYALPSAPADVVELLKVSKNIYGGLTALYCYDNSGDGIGEGSLTTGSFTARAGLDVANLGTDSNIVSSSLFKPDEGFVDNFVLKIAAFETLATDSTEFSGNSGQVFNFFLGIKTVEADSAFNFSSAPATTLSSGNVFNFELANSEQIVEGELETASFSASAGAVSNFELKVTLIEVDSETDTASFAASSGAIPSFTLG